MKFLIIYFHLFGVKYKNATVSHDPYEWRPALSPLKILIELDCEVAVGFMDDTGGWLFTHAELCCDIIIKGCLFYSTSVSRWLGVSELHAYLFPARLLRAGMWLPR